MTKKAQDVLKRLNRKRSYVIRATGTLYVQTVITASSPAEAKRMALKDTGIKWESGYVQHVFMPSEIDIDPKTIEVERKD